MLSFRTNVLATYTTDGGVQLGLGVADSRAYLDDVDSPVTTSEVNAVELQLAYLLIPLGDGATARIGRQVVDLGSRRYVAFDDYRNTANGFTGIRTDFPVNGKLRATLFAFLPQYRLPDDQDGLRHNHVVVDRESFRTAFAGGVVGVRNLLPWADADFAYYGLFEKDGGRRRTRDRQLHTLTGRLFREPRPGQIDFEIEYARQFGTVSESDQPAAPKRDVSAWFLHAEIGRQWSGGWKPRLAAELEWASGDHGGARFNRFDTLYGSRRPDLGPTGIFGALTRANIIAPALRGEVAPDKRSDAFIAWRPLWLASRTDAFSATGVRDRAGRSGRFAGHQIEARIRRWLVPERLRAEVSAATLFKGRFMREAPNAPDTGDSKYVAIALTAFF